MVRNPRRPSKRIFRWQDYLESILIAILLALVVRTFVVTGYRVPTTTMAPNLLPGDFIFSFRLPYGVRIPLTDKKWAMGIPERGEIVVFTFPDQPRTNYVKRVIGLPGDLIEIRKGRLRVNGKELEYQQIPQLPPEVEEIASETDLWMELAPEGSRQVLKQKKGTDRNFGPISVPQDEVFLLGDNRDASDDSRYWGTVPVARVEGRVFLIWLSLSWRGPSGPLAWPQMRWDRAGSFLKH